MEKSQPLHEHVVGLSGLAFGMSLALIEAGRIKAKDLTSLLRLVYAYICITVSPEAARPIAHAMTLIAGFESSGKDVRHSLSLALGLLLRERPERREALVTWLSYATQDEIQDELAEFLGELLDTKPKRADDARTPE